MIDLLGGGVQASLVQLNGLTITATIGVLAVSLALWTMVRPGRFPPGPRGLPIVGAIYGMNDSPEIVFGNWAKKYGDIFGFKVGEKWMVVLNGSEVIKDALVKHGADFAGRPEFYSMQIFTDGGKDIVFGQYTETWKLHRKLAHTALRHFATGKPLQDLITSVYPKIQTELAANGDKPINPKIMLNLLLYNILSQMCFGKSYDLKDPSVMEFMKLNDDANEQFGLGLAADFFSWARYIPTSGPRLLKKFTKFFQSKIQEEINDTKKRYDPENINDVYSLLQKAQEDARREGENVDKLTDTHVMQTIMDVFSAGIQTSTETLYWAIAQMCEHPEVQNKIQEEIDRVLGRDNVPNISDRGTLPYTEATLYEVMRYSTIVPLLLPHTPIKDTEFRGYVIPKGAMMMFNVHSMHFDANEWDDPECFKPEHFLDESGTVRQHPSGFLPFGAGRRSCLGEAVAKADLFLIFTWFMQNYSFTKLPGKETESIINMIPKTASGRLLLPYEVVIKPRN